MDRSDIIEMLHEDGCVVCGDEAEDEYLLCHSCNRHGPVGGGWQSARPADLKNVLDEHQTTVLAMLDEE